MEAIHAAKTAEKALKAARKQNIYGARLTPFLLKSVVEYTAGKSLQANIKLVENNVVLGVELAKKLQKMQHSHEQNLKKNN